MMDVISNWSELISHFLLFDSAQSDRDSAQSDRHAERSRSTNHEINFVQVLNTTLRL